MQSSQRSADVHGDHSVHSDLRRARALVLRMQLWVQLLRSWTELRWISLAWPRGLKSRACAGLCRRHATLSNAGYAHTRSLAFVFEVPRPSCATPPLVRRLPRPFTPTPKLSSQQSIKKNPIPRFVRIPQPTAPMVAFAMASGQVALSRALEWCGLA